MEPSAPPRQSGQMYSPVSGSRWPDAPSRALFTPLYQEFTRKCPLRVRFPGRCGSTFLHSTAPCLSWQTLEPEGAHVWQWMGLHAAYTHCLEKGGIRMAASPRQHSK